VQPKNFNTAQSYMAWTPDGLPKYQQEFDTKVPQPNPGHSQGAHEEATPWYMQHNPQDA
jgi:hypothetical protein